MAITAHTLTFAGRSAGLVLAQDITARKRAEESLQASEEYYRALAEQATDLIGVLSADGTFRYVSPSYRRVLGYAPKDIVGRQAFTVIHPDDVSSLREAFATLLHTGGTSTAAFRMRHATGAWRQMEVVAVDKLDDPIINGIITTTRDITERAQANEALQVSEERFRGAFAHTAVGMGLIGLDGRFLQVNAAICHIVGYSEEELLRMTVPALTHPEDRERRREAVRQLMEGSLPSYQDEFRYIHKDGSVVYGMASMVLLRDGQGQPIHVIAQLQDITPRKVAEEALRANEGLFRAVWEHANDSVAILTPEGTYRYVSPSHVRLLGRTSEETMLVMPTANMHPDDLTWAGPRLAALLRTPGAVDTVEVRMRHQDGSWRWVESVAANHTDDPIVNGTIIHSRDITERKRAAEALRASEERLRTVVTNTPVILFAFDEAGIFTLSEGQGLAALGLEPGALVGQSVFDVYAEIPTLLAHVRRTLAGASFTARDHVGGVVFETRWAPSYGPDGRRQGVLGISTNVTEQVRAEDELRHQALHDSLTDLPNRTLLHARITAARGDGADVSPLALLLLDLDHFKEVNDSLGHTQGDGLLRVVADRLRGLVRADDTVARLGGDEFAVLLPGADATTAQRVAAALRAVLDAPLSVEGHLLRVGASVGIALSPAHGVDGTTLLRRADVAMYTAKRGRLGQALYEPAQDQHSPERLARIAALREAIEQGTLTLHYQPLTGEAKERYTKSE